MTNKEVVFLIEDDELYLDMYTQILGDEFETIPFTSAQEALSKYNELKPKTIVLDLNLPDMNGVQFCESLFANHCTNDEVDIIFVTGEIDPQIKLKAFEVGAADYIIKPFEIKELLYKVSASVQRKLKEADLLKEALDSQKIIYTTMEQASQYGQVMSFYKNLNNCQNNEEIAHIFFESMKYFGLISSLQITLPNKEYFRHDNLAISPIEKDVYALLEQKGRIFEFSNRIIINDEHVSFIIKNPPKDEHHLGQLRDYTASIVEGLEMKVMDLYAQQEMEYAISQLSSNIEGLKLGVNQHNHVINSVMSNMLINISESYHSLEMTDPQETFLNDLIENGTQELSQAETYLVDIMSRLENLKQQMEGVQKATKPKGIIKADSNDIELF